LPFLALLVICFGVHVFFLFRIDGVYEDLQMGCDCNYEFKGGQIYIVEEDGLDHIGTYTRTGDRWVFKTLKGLGGEFYMESSLLGVKWSYPQFYGGAKFLPRRCFSPFAATLYDWHIRL